MARRILVVDDEAVVLAAVRKTLSKDAIEIDVTQDAREALQLLATTSYDVVITDLMMPGVDGLELLEHIQQMRSGAQSIMITGYPTIKTALRAKQLGAFEYVTKPFTRQELRSVVVRAIRRGIGGRASGGPAVSPGPARDLFQIPDHSWVKVETDGKVRVGMTQAFAATVGEIVGLHLPALHDLLEQGRACIRVQAADGVEHSLHGPMSGQVVAINEAVVGDPGLAARDPEGTGWLLVLEPYKLERELVNLVPL